MHLGVYSPPMSESSQSHNQEPEEVNRNCVVTKKELRTLERQLADGLKRVRNMLTQCSNCSSSTIAEPRQENTQEEQQERENGTLRSPQDFVREARVVPLPAWGPSSQPPGESNRSVSSDSGSDSDSDSEFESGTPHKDASLNNVDSSHLPIRSTNQESSQPPQTLCRCLSGGFEEQPVEPWKRSSLARRSMSGNMGMHLPNAFSSRRQSRAHALGILLGSMGHPSSSQDQQHTRRTSIVPENAGIPSLCVAHEDSSSGQDSFNNSPAVTRRGAWDRPMSSNVEKEAVACSRRDSKMSTLCSTETRQSVSVMLAFEVLDIWSCDEIFCPPDTRFSNVDEYAHSRNSHGKINLQAISPRVQLRPHGAARKGWDLVTLLLVLCDCIIVPLHLMELQITMMLSCLNWSSRLLWTIGIFVTASTGYLEYDGRIEMDRVKVMRRYMRSWFAFDATLCLVDWIDFGLSYTSDGLVHAGITSIMKSLRMARLLRLVRIQKVMATLIERIRSEKLILVASITKILFLILVIPHVFACIWYALGRSDQNGQNTWMQASGLAEKSVGELYMISFHFSLAQFSGLGFDEVHAQNMVERFFAIFVTFIAFAVASFVVSSLTSTMTRLQMVAGKQSMQFTMLRRYLEEKAVSADLKVRIMRTVQHRVKEQERHTAEGDVNLLEHLSEPLKIHLNFELRSKTFSWHPFMKRFCSSHPEVMGKVCHSCVSFTSVSSGDIVFSQGEQPDHGQMLFVEDGTFVYRRTKGTTKEVIVYREQWIAEAFLWTTWVHRGTLEGKAESRLLELDSEKFQRVLSQFLTAEIAPIQYAKHFVEYLNSHEGPDLDDLTIVPDHVRDERRLSLSSQGPMTLIQQWLHVPGAEGVRAISPHHSGQRDNDL